MHKYARKVMVTIGTGALLVGLVGTMTGTSSAANLTGGQYTYVVNGEEYSFPFDPVKVSSGLLLPVEVFQKFDINVEDPLTRNVTLKKGDVADKIILGTTTYDMNGQPESSDASPMRLNGRLFVSADLLKDFGIDFSQDGNFVVMRDFTDGMPTTKKVSGADLEALKVGRTITNQTVKADSSIYLSANFTLLSPDLLATDGLGLNFGTRARLQSMVQTNTLVMVKLSNYSFKGGKVDPTGFTLVDDQRHQYDLITTLDTGDGAITARMSPGADRVGILVFPKATNSANLLTLYFDPNGASLGIFNNIR